jgi:hypothetical protein
MWLSIAALDMCLIFVAMITYPHTGMNSWVCLFFIYYDFCVLSLFLKFKLTQQLISLLTL